MIKTIEKVLKVETKRQEYIHYGHKEFINELFEPIRERALFVKPYGGLWASRSDSTDSWKKWCESNEFHLSKYSDDNYFKFYLKQGTRLLIIDHHEQLNDLPHIEIKKKYGIEMKELCFIDFQKLAKEYDAMEVLISKDYQLYWDLYGWDCDSLLVFNKDCIESISKEKL